MKYSYWLIHQFIASILFISLCLPSCNDQKELPNQIEERPIGEIVLTQENHQSFQETVAQEDKQTTNWLYELKDLDKVKAKGEHMNRPVDNHLTGYQNLPDVFINRENPFEKCPEEIRFMILERAAISNYLSNGNTGSLLLVCRDWRDIMGQNKMKRSIKSIKHEYLYQRFLKGILVYRPNEESDDGQIDLPIAALDNPLEGTFDLSQCGDVAGKYLTISTGYRKEKKAENENKIEIWLTPRFLVAKEINGSAQHYQDIFPNQWSAKAPIGILWSYGSSDEMEWYTYLTTNTMDELGNNNMYEKWLESKTAADGYAGGLRELIPWCGAQMQYFYIYFKD